MTENYLSFKHYPIKSANADFDTSRRKRFKVTTINWTFATENGKQGRDKVHKNAYDMTLDELVEWIRDTDEVAEDIINIEGMDKT